MPSECMMSLSELAHEALLSLGQGSTAAEILDRMQKLGPIPWDLRQSVGGREPKHTNRVLTALAMLRDGGRVVKATQSHWWPTALGPASDSREPEPEWGYCSLCRRPIPLSGMPTQMRERRCLEHFKAREQERYWRPDVLAKERERAKRRYAESGEAEREKCRAYYLANSERIKERSKAWQKANPEKQKGYARTTHQREKDRPLTAKQRIDRSMSQGIRNSLRGRKAGRRWETLVGYSLDELVARLESTFAEGMSWDNYGKGPDRWSIDHVVPRAAFRYESAEDPAFLECYGLPNLSASWFPDNSKKSSNHGGFRHYHHREPVPLRV